MQSVWMKFGACAVALACGLSGCGGGAEERPNPAKGPLSSAVQDTGTVLVPVTIGQLLDYVEGVSPFVFGPAGQPDLRRAPFTYRYYPLEQNYAGATDDGEVYVYGNASGWQMWHVGSLAGYTCLARPQNCLPSAQPGSWRLEQSVNEEPLRADVSPVAWSGIVARTKLPSVEYGFPWYTTTVHFLTPTSMSYTYKGAGFDSPYTNEDYTLTITDFRIEPHSSCGPACGVDAQIAFSVTYYIAQIDRIHSWGNYSMPWRENYRFTRTD